MHPVERVERLLLQVEHSRHPDRVGRRVVNRRMQGLVHQLDDVVGKFHRMILSEGGGHGR